jgi:hypothetical protein
MLKLLGKREENMIRFLTASTFETDDPRIAASEVLKQLDTEHSLLKNSAGLLFCSLDFISSGAAEEVSKALPFETIGCTTHGIAVPGAMGEIMLAVAVLTSDDAFFMTGLSDSLEEDAERRIGELYGRLSGCTPSLMLVCHSNPECLSGNEALQILNRLSGGTPVFGTNALDAAPENRTPMIIHNGRAYSDRLALLLLCGAVPESRFAVKSLPAMNFYSQPVTVTGAQGNRLISINNMPAAEFMEKLGIISGGKLNAIRSFPLLIDNNDGEGAKSCGIHSIEEGGVLRCGSAVARGATLKFANQMREEVLCGSEQLAESIKNEHDKRVHLIFSCFSRSAPLVDLKDEMRLFQKNLEESSYVFIYSAGEFCPVYDHEGGIHNRFHQFSIISLSF